MCQLLGMNCATPTDFNFSFRGFKCRGGNTDIHAHGWGLAIYEGRGVRTFHDPLPCAQSPLADMVSRYPIKTLNMMAHIRYATQGAVSLENVHPFQREMWGIQWTFAHNGEVPKFTRPTNPQENCLGGGCGEAAGALPMLGGCKEAVYHPVGDTDSEAVFCAMLNALRSEFATLPTLPVLYEAIQRLCSEIVRGHEQETIFNFLLSASQFTMFAFSWPGSREGSSVWNGLHYLVRYPPFRTAKLRDVDYELDFNETNDERDRVAIIATKPLTTNENWREFERGQLLMFDNGLPYSRPYECAGIERIGRGLSSRAVPISPLCPNQHQHNIPTLLRRAVCEALGREDAEEDCCSSAWAERAVDLGCGAGESGAQFRRCARHLTGVDLNPEMAKEAQDRGCYDSVVVGDAECILHSVDREGRCGYDFVFACDLFPYVGDLRPMFNTVRRSLDGRRGGTFAFSAEVMGEPPDRIVGIGEDSNAGGDSDDNDNTTEIFIGNRNSNSNIHEDGEGFVLQNCARFAHRRWYIRSLAEDFGFEILSCKESAVLRQHDGMDVLGALFVLSLPHSVAHN